MGRAYQVELSELESTWNTSARFASAALQEFVARNSSDALVAVGSGGSLSSAHLAAMLHRWCTHRPAAHMTPLEALTTPVLRDTAYVLLSGGGRNGDILSVLERCIENEVRSVAVLCGDQSSPLVARARTHGRYSVVPLPDLPNDGFLATNRLLATSLVLAKGFGTELSEHIPRTNAPFAVPQFDSLQVLHGGWASPAATDLESKLHESALASAAVSDFRNFGHGRHLWLARRPRTAVVALIEPALLNLARRTLRQLPAETPVIELESKLNGPQATLDLLVQSFRLIGQLGDLAEVDPGRPQVPDFGRRLYHLRVGEQLGAESAEMPVRRKQNSASTPPFLPQYHYEGPFRRFLQRLSVADISGLVLDYDGTLCGREARYTGPNAEACSEIERLLAQGLSIAIATGRGSSAAEALMTALPRRLWSRVVIGMHNGAEVGMLGEAGSPVEIDSAGHSALREARLRLESDRLIRDSCEIRVSDFQVSLSPARDWSLNGLATYVGSLMSGPQDFGVRLSKSSHSVDLVAPGVSKTRVIAELRSRIPPGDVICVGDLGRWPGNDAALLASREITLSCDEVSPDTESCWNLAPAGVFGPGALLRYLRAIRPMGGTFRFLTSSLAEG